MPNFVILGVQNVIFGGINVNDPFNYVTVGFSYGVASRANPLQIFPRYVEILQPYPKPSINPVFHGVSCFIFLSELSQSFASTMVTLAPHSHQ